MQSKSRCPSDFRIRLRNSLDLADHQRRGASAALAAALWVLNLKLRHDCMTAYQLERLFEPEAFSRNGYGDIYHRNKWAKYEVGLHTPEKALVQRIEAISPGSAHILYHPLWALLRCKTPQARDLTHWLSQLSPEILTIVQDRRHVSPFGGAPRRKINKVHVKMIERRAGLDALAALTILLLESIDQGDEDSAFAFAESLWRTLLMLSGILPFLYVASELFDLFRLRIFPLVVHKGIGFDFTHYDFKEAVFLLTKLLLTLEDQGLVNGASPAAAFRIKQQLFDGRYGFDVPFALRPPLKPCEQRNAQNEHLYEQCEIYEKRRAWGLSILRANRYEHFPPDWLA